MTTLSTAPATRTEPVQLLGLGLAAPAGTSFRLDQPCVAEHGSIGGWRRDAAGELAFTLLWRPPGYWQRQPSETADIASLQAEFVRQALTRTRRDGHRVNEVERGPVTVAGHVGELVDISIEVRRRLGRTRLRRRQVLWTCPDSGRHLAFEMSARAEEADPVGASFAAMVPTLHCHREG